MKRKPRDRHLDAPAEANRDKHINFVALERGEKDPADAGPAKATGETREKEEKRKVKNRKIKNRKIKWNL
jgi:hypothetical protein